MFQKKYRLPANVRLSHPENTYTAYFLAKIAKNNLDFNRYGFIISKKVAKLAVDRNRLKRRFRAALEEMHKNLPVGYDFLFSLKKEAMDQTTQVLHDEIKKTLDKWENKV
jgi:ribonuclease P protein component